MKDHVVDVHELLSIRLVDPNGLDFDIPITYPSLIWPYHS